MKIIIMALLFTTVLTACGLKGSLYEPSESVNYTSASTSSLL